MNYRLYRQAVALAFMSVIGLGAALPGQGAFAQNAKVSDAERANFEKIIREYLLEHPDVIAEAMDRYFEQRDQRVAEEAVAALETHHDEIFNDPSSPVAGNPEGKITVVEFFDYNCSFCRLALPTIVDLIEDSDDIRFVFKEFPIRGEDSKNVSHAALAAENQGKYLEYHVALMSSEGQMTLDRAEDIAKDEDLDLKRLRKEMKTPAFDDWLERNDKVAQALHIDGTPTFIVGNEFVRGWPGEEEFLAIVDKAREAASGESPQASAAPKTE